MDELRKPLFIAAIVLIGLAFFFEIGSPLILGSLKVSPEQLRATADDQLKKDPAFQDAGERKDLLDGMQDKLNSSRQEKKPPGYGIPATAMLDVLLIYSALWMGLSLIVTERVQGRLQGIVSLVISLLLLIASIVFIFRSIVVVMIMVGLLFSVPFGTIVYMAVYGFFNRASAGVVLGWAMFFKLCFAVCLVLAHQGFLRNKGLILLTLSSLLATFLVSFLHNLVPTFLVSITDIIGAIIVSIITLIWSIVLLIFGIIAVVKAVA